MTLRRVFRETAELFWRVPWLWVPVLLADVCKYVTLTAAAPLRGAVIPLSVLGRYGGVTATDATSLCCQV